MPLTAIRPQKIGGLMNELQKQAYIGLAAIEKTLQNISDAGDWDNLASATGSKITDNGDLVITDFLEGEITFDDDELELGEDIFVDVDDAIGSAQFTSGVTGGTIHGELSYPEYDGMSYSVEIKGSVEPSDAIATLYSNGLLMEHTKTTCGIKDERIYVKAEFTGDGEFVYGANLGGEGFYGEGEAIREAALAAIGGDYAKLAELLSGVGCFADESADELIDVLPEKLAIYVADIKFGYPSYPSVDLMIDHVTVDPYYYREFQDYLDDEDLCYAVLEAVPSAAQVNLDDFDWSELDG